VIRVYEPDHKPENVASVAIFNECIFAFKILELLIRPKYFAEIVGYYDLYRTFKKSMLETYTAILVHF